MVIKNFLPISSLIKTAVWIAVFGSLLGCSLRERRSDQNEGPAVLVERRNTPPEQTVEIQDTVPVAGPEVVTQGEVPKVGVILGPGGMKAYASIGVLKSLLKAKVPVDAIVGIGWGAPMALAYASQGSVFDAEWKMFKIDEGELASKGLLTQSLKAESIESLDDFMSENFGGTELGSLTIPFACPIRSVFNDEPRFLERGDALDNLKLCWSTPPFFEPHKRQYAAISAIAESAQHLRSRGADIVILIDPLRSGPIVPKEDLDSEFTTHIFWSEIRQSIKKQSGRVNEVIGVQSRDMTLLSTDARREYVRLGEQAGEAFARQLVEKYGF